MFAEWSSPSGDTEFAVSFDQQRTDRVLFVPALFDESNKLRRLTLQVMRRINAAGIDSFLPDLPGCHESFSTLSDQTLVTWQAAVAAAAKQFNATHVMSFRAGAVLAPYGLPGWRYAPITGARTLKALLRGRIVASKETGSAESTEQLLELGERQGLTLAGYDLSAEMISQLADHAQLAQSCQMELLQSDIGGAGLWLKAEPSEDEAQADALAAAIVAGVNG